MRSLVIPLLKRVRIAGAVMPALFLGFVFGCSFVEPDPSADREVATGSAGSTSPSAEAPTATELPDVADGIGTEVVIDPTPVSVAPVDVDALDDSGGAGVVTQEALGLLILDPLVDWPLNHFPLGEVYSGLVKFDGTLAGIVEPELARSWVVEDDGLRYLFTLRDGLRFSDGSPVTATDFKWSWERSLRPENLTPGAVHVFGAIEGAAAMMAGDADSLTGVTAIDGRTLEVVLVRPQAHFLSMLAMPLASVLNKENFESWGTINWTTAEVELRKHVDYWGLIYDELPVGTGPFRVVSVDFLEHVTLEPNPHYHREENRLRELHIKLPDFGGADFEQFVDPFGESDVRPWSPGSISVTPSYFYDDDGVAHAYDPDEVHDHDHHHPHPPAGALDESMPVLPEDFDAPSEYLVGAPDATPAVRAPEVVWLAFNSSVAPFDNLEFRRALLSSLRRPGDNEPKSIGVPEDWATGLLPPGFIGGGRNLIDPEPNESEAIGHYSASGYLGEELPGRLEFHLDASLPGRNYFFGLSKNWRSWLGLEFRDTSPEPVRSILTYHWHLDEGFLQMRYVHVKPRYPDPCAALCRIPDLFGPNAQSAETEQLREMLHDAAATADRAARIAKYQAIEEHVLERALVVPIAWDDGTELLEVKPWISGYRLPAYGGSQYAGVVVDTTHPEYPADR